MLLWILRLNSLMGRRECLYRMSHFVLHGGDDDVRGDDAQVCDSLIQSLLWLLMCCQRGRPLSLMRDARSQSQARKKYPILESQRLDENIC